MTIDTAQRTIGIPFSGLYESKFDALKFGAALAQEIETAKREQDSASGDLSTLLMVQVCTLQSVQLALLRAMS